MNIDEMLELIDDWTSEIANEYCTVSARNRVYKDAKQIKDALKAGQDMRNASTDWDANNAHAAWDEATKEEEV